MSDMKYPSANSGSVCAWLFTNMLARLTGLVSFGANKVVLSWNSDEKTITLSEVDDQNIILNPIFSISTDKVTHFGFTRSSINIIIGTANYDLLLRDMRVSTKLNMDSTQVIDAATGGILSKNIDARNEIRTLQALLAK